MKNASVARRTSPLLNDETMEHFTEKLGMSFLEWEFLMGNRVWGLVGVALFLRQLLLTSERGYNYMGIDLTARHRFRQQS